MKYVLDNSNLAESYSGVTTPLTYSFANHVYGEVYKHFCEKMGVSKAVIGQHKEMFSNLLSFVGYRMYYNLRNWHSLVSFLPAYKFNRPFFDRMIGAETDHSYYEIPIKGSFRKYGIELPRVTVQVLRIGFSFLFMGALVRRFNREFDRIFSRLESIHLTSLDPLALASLYFNVSQKLLARWWIPIANDFAVMVSTGIVNKALIRWVGQTDIASHLYFKARGSLLSLDPGRFLVGLVGTINKDKAIYELFRKPLEPAQLLQLLSQRYPASETYRLVKEYLVNYGARVPNELKLESETLSERPEHLLNLLQTLVRTNNTEVQEPGHQKDLLQNRNLCLNPVQRRLLKWLLSWVGSSIRRREETRFRRALIFGYVRRIFLTLGSKLHDTGVLADQRDIFYLTEDEVFGLLKDSQDFEFAKALVARRKAELEEWKRLELPRRIETDGHFEELLEKLKMGSHRNLSPLLENGLKGRVAARGHGELVRGTALVLPDFSISADYQGKVLVTRQTDPGWTIVFPFVKALIVERGGILSHAAIVARELGIPCVVGVEGATSLIPDGAMVEIMLGTGEIRVRMNSEYPSPTTPHPTTLRGEI